MNIFHSNIINIYNKKGQAWLNELPRLVTAISSKFDLRDLKEATNLTYNYVLSGFQGDNPIILKLGLDHEALTREAFALRCFEGCGAVNVLAEDHDILLLERAMPGTSLKSYFPTKEKESIEIACGVMQKLHQTSIPTTHNFLHIKDWLTALDKNWAIPDAYLQKARKLRDRLLQTSKSDVLLHGDLHHDNILQNGNDESRPSSQSEDGWLVIDPKGVIGEQAYEVAAFIRNPMPDLLNIQDPEEIIQRRIVMFSDLLNVPRSSVADWCFVQAVLSWVWAIEDGCDDTYSKNLTEFFERYTDV